MATSADFTHFLRCRHCIGPNCRNYKMKCIFVATTKAGKAKIILFGKRSWKSQAEAQTVRYVEPNRLIERPAE